MPDDKQEKDHPATVAEDSRTNRSFIEHLLSQPEGPETPRVRVVPREVKF